MNGGDIIRPDSTRSGMVSYMEQNIQIQFPFEPYPAQKQMMAKMIQAFENKQNCVLESPTGSGKSLAIICAAIAWTNHQRTTPSAETRHSWRSNDHFDYDDSPQVSRDTGNKPKVPKVYIGSRTHKQIAQLVKELKQNTVYKPQMAVLGSRVQYCIEEKVRKSDNIQDECAKLCEMSKMSREKKRHTQAQAPFYDYTRARGDYLTMMENLAIGRRPDDEDLFFVNDTVYNESENEHTPQISKKKRKKKKKKKKKPQTDIKTEDNGVICIDTSDEEEEEDNKERIPYKNVHILENHPDLRRDGPHHLWDIEDLVQLGREVNGCPYFTSRILAKEAEIVFCPYNYLIDPCIRASMNINLDNDIVIIDEAHNIESVCREAGSFEMSYLDILRVKIELKEAVDSFHLIEPNSTMLNVINNVMTWFTETDFDFSDGEKSDKLLKCWSGRLILPQLEKMDITKQSYMSQIKPAFEKILDHYNRQSGDDKANEAEHPGEDEEDDQEYEHYSRITISTKSLRVLEKLTMILGFLFNSQKNYLEDYILGVLKKKPTMRFGRLVEEPRNKVLENMDLCLWTMNPGIIFNQISETTHSIVLTSGTLTPLETFVSELQAEFPVKLIADHVINESQVWAGVIPYGPNNFGLNGVAKNITQSAYQQGVCEALCNIAYNVPYGVLAFFSSYRVMNIIISYMKESGLYESLEKRKKIFIEPRNVTAEVFNKELNRYYKCIKEAEDRDNLDSGITGGFFFAVYRGKVSEGIDFNNNNCRAVICISIPFPNYGDTLVKLKQSYNNTKRSRASYNDRNKYLGGYEWYEIQGYRALNQALGRCIRHRKDWGAVILLDQRFMQYDKRRFLSSWVESLCKVQGGKFSTTMADLKNFMDRHYRIEKDERDRRRIEHPEEFNRWDDVIGVTGAGSTSLVQPKQENERTAIIRHESMIKDEDFFDDDWDLLIGTSNINIKKEVKNEHSTSANSALLRREPSIYDDDDGLNATMPGAKQEKLKVKNEPSSSTSSKLIKEEEVIWDEYDDEDLDTILGIKHEKTKVKNEPSSSAGSNFIKDEDFSWDEDGDDLDEILGSMVVKSELTNNYASSSLGSTLRATLEDDDIKTEPSSSNFNKKGKQKAKFQENNLLGDWGSDDNEMDIPPTIPVKREVKQEVPSTLIDNDDIICISDSPPYLSPSVVPMTIAPTTTSSSSHKRNIMESSLSCDTSDVNAYKKKKVEFVEID